MLTEKRFQYCVYVYVFFIIVYAIVAGIPATFGQDELPPPPEPVPQYATVANEYLAYSLAKINVGDAIAAIDVYTIWNGQVVVTEAVETKKKGEFVFTGPPGKYTIRITTYDPAKGFATYTAYTVIKSAGNNPVDPISPVDPVVPPTPVDPNTPSTGPPAEGKFGIGLVAYNWLVKNRPGNVTGVRQLAAAYEWAASAKPTGNSPITSLNAELKKRIDPIYEADPSLAGLRTAMQSIAGRHISTGIMSNLDDYQTAYRETAIGIRAAYGK